ncbi:MAG: hypothetical protein LQ351_008172, partial [Letrouitia transgressa]
DLANTFAKNKRAVPILARALLLSVTPNSSTNDSTSTTPIGSGATTMEQDAAAKYEIIIYLGDNDQQIAI